MNLIKRISWRRISQSEIRNLAAAEKNWNRKARAGKNSFPPTPFLFARPSVKVFQNSAFGFLLKKVRISFSVRSQIVCCEFVASALRASAGRLYSICQDFLGSIATFCESKTRFAVAKQRINEVYEPILFIPSASGRTESKTIIPACRQAGLIAQKRYEIFFIH